MISGDATFSGGPNYRTNMGISAGAGVLFDISDLVALSLEVRNNRGVSDISGVSLEGEGTVKTNTFFGLLGLAFKLAHRSGAAPAP